MRQRTHELALCSMLGALAAVFLCVGGAFPLALYTAPLLASCTLLIAREEARRSYAWACYAAAAALGMLLSPDKEGALLFVFFGYYPLCKPALDRLARLPRIAVKLALFTVSIGGMYALLLFVFRLEALVREFAETSRPLLLATLALGLAVFVVYDLALDRLAAVYRARRKKEPTEPKQKP